MYGGYVYVATVQRQLSKDTMTLVVVVVGHGGGRVEIVVLVVWKTYRHVLAVSSVQISLLEKCREE